MKNIKNIVTFVSTVMAGRTAISRLKQAREDGDRLELVDAAAQLAWSWSPARSSSSGGCAGARTRRDRQRHPPS